MGTNFGEIYDRALFRISNYDFLKIDTDKREDILFRYLLSAQTDFNRSCKKDLTKYNREEQCYEDMLTEEEIEILALGVAYYWVSSKTLNSKLFKNTLTSKDYQMYSPANLLKELQALRKTLKDEFNGKINAYSFRQVE